MCTILKVIFLELFNCNAILRIKSITGNIFKLLTHQFSSQVVNGIEYV